MEMPTLAVRGSSQGQVPALVVRTQEMPTPEEFRHRLEPDLQSKTTAEKRFDVRCKPPAEFSRP